MIRFRVISVGKPPKDWRQDGFQHFEKMLASYARIEEVSVKEQKIAGNVSIDEGLQRESNAIVRALQPSSYKIALDLSGKQYSTEDFADHIGHLLQQYSAFEFVIGGPYGLHRKTLSAVDEVLSLSRMTFPHDLARINLIEQLYRTISLLNNLPYHK